MYSSTQCIYGILSSLAEVEYQVYSYTQSYSRDSVYTSRGRISSSIVLHSLIHGILSILAEVEYQGVLFYTVLFTVF